MSFYEKSALAGNHVGVVVLWSICAIVALNAGTAAAFDYNFITSFVTLQTADYVHMVGGFAAAVSVADIVGLVDLNEQLEEMMD